jgi:hypothetical protein
MGSAGEVVATTNGTALTTRSSAGTYSTECTCGTKLALALDGANTRWIVNGSNQLAPCAAGTTSATTLQLPINTTGVARSIAIDSAGNVWVLGANITEVIGVAVPPTLPLALPVRLRRVRKA